MSEDEFRRLRKLTERGDIRAKSDLKREIIVKFKEDCFKFNLFLFYEDYFSFFSEDELISELLSLEEKNVLDDIKRYTSVNYYPIIIDIKESFYEEFYRTDDHYHFFMQDGHIFELEVLLGSNSGNVLDLLSKLTHLEVLYLYTNSYIERLTLDIESESIKEIQLYSIKDIIIESFFQKAKLTKMDRLYVSKRMGFMAFSLNSLNLEFLKSLTSFTVRGFSSNELPDSIKLLDNLKII